MNPSLAFEIAELALSLARRQAGGNVQQHATVVDTLLKIMQKGAQAYREHTGEALDPSLIRAEEPV